jgi:mono/diheme cytochrome c family protein
MEMPMIPALILAVVIANPSGAKLFEARGCARCHSVGAGPVVGPDLAGVGQRFTRQQLIAWILNPDRQRNAGYPRMPQLGVSPRDAATIADFLLQQREVGRIAEWQSSSNHSASKP